MRAIEQIIENEVMCCMSSLVATLASGAHAITPHRDLRVATESLVELTEQAFELAAPIPDYEEAAIQQNFKQLLNGRIVHRDTAETDYDDHSFDNWEEACREHDIEPYDREVYEHWAVSSWLAEKLIAAGEKVDKDFAGLCIWARTTTGQAIYCDGVIERIYADMMKA